MTFQQLQYLLEVSKSGSVTKAAKNLFVSYSSVSISISNLEKELGYPLFVRSTTGLTPTPRGEKVLEHARQICRSYTLLSSVDQEDRRTLRIAGVDNPLFARAFGQVVEENLYREDVRFIYQSLGEEESQEQLLQNRLDLSLRMLLDFAFGYWEKRLAKSGLHREILKTIPAAVRVGKGHPLYDAQRVLPHELGSHTLIDTPVRSISSSSLFSGTIYTDPGKILFASAAGVQRELVSRGLGYSICSMPAPGHRADGLRYIPLEGVSYHLLAISNPNQPQAPEIGRFLQLLRQEFEAAYPQI